MILYFTATGNSRWIAELLAEAMHDTAVSIVDCLKQGSIPAGLSTADRLGIVFPVHSWYAPRVLIDFFVAAPVAGLLLPLCRVYMRGRYGKGNEPPGGTFSVGCSLVCCNAQYLRTDVQLG